MLPLMVKGSINQSAVMVPPGQGWSFSSRNPCGRGSRALWCYGGRAAGGELPQLCLWAQEAAKGCASGMQEGHGYA